MQKVDSSGQDPSPRRRMIVQVIDDAVQRNGYPPSLREIGEAVGLASTSSPKLRDPADANTGSDLGER